MSVRPEVVAAFEAQIRWCMKLGSPFTAAVLGAALDDLRAGGPVARLLGGWLGDPAADALPLRLAGGLHALVLSGRDGALAALYPPHGQGGGQGGRQGGGPGEGAGRALATVLPDAVARHDGFLRDWLTSPPQTNEVGRAGVLLGGFLEIAQDFRLPLHLLEIGASAGLNMVWDRFRYDIAGAGWGDGDSPVVLAPHWTGPRPPLEAPLTIAGCAGCDRRPVDITQETERLRLRAFVWADQPARMRALEGAMDLALRLGTRVEAADAADWVERHLAAAQPEVVTVLYHTIVWQYLPTGTQARIRMALDGYGVLAPLAWLRLELGPTDRCELTLTTWSRGLRTERVLAEAHPHGAWVRWG
ncbi:MAG: hypothetical protein RLY86_465 [Pseudomonadota bacterium]|jgi:hypothetical protein